MIINIRTNHSKAIEGQRGPKNQVCIGFKLGHDVLTKMIISGMMRYQVFQLPRVNGESIVLF